MASTDLATGTTTWVHVTTTLETLPAPEEARDFALAEALAASGFPGAGSARAGFSIERRRVLGSRTMHVRHQEDVTTLVLERDLPRAYVTVVFVVSFVLAAFLAGQNPQLFSVPALVVAFSPFLGIPVARVVARKRHEALLARIADRYFAALAPYQAARGGAFRGGEGS